MVITNIHDAKTQFSQLVARVRQGEEIIIGKAGKPVAKLIPFIPSSEERRPGILRGKIKIAEDFDELPAEIANAFGIDSK